VARLVYDLFGASGPRLLARRYVDEMIPGARDAAGGGQSDWARGAPLSGGRVASAASRRLEAARGRFGARSDADSHRMEDIYGSTRLQGRPAQGEGGVAGVSAGVTAWV